MRRPAAVLAALAAAAGCAGCSDRDGAVELAFRPTEGTELAYVTTVESTTATDVPCQTPERRTDRTTLQTTHRVLEVGDEGVRVEVALSRPGIGTRTVIVRFDRAAQLTEIEEVEGIAAAALGELGLSEVFPAAAGAPPAEPLAPGERWAIDDEVRLDADAAPTRLRGEGRLVELGVEDGRATATVETTARLPVATSSASELGTRSLAGEQVSAIVATYDLADGALRRAESVTTGSFRLELGPPPGGAGEPCVGTLEVTVRSRVSRRA
jgi:hypothetical protein